jgi:carbon-monoxide dehydrogenase medium subunit
VKPAPFDYHRAASVDDAVEALAATGGKVLAGGQSLVPILSMRLAAPPALVDINHIDRLDTIEVGDGGVRVGALVRHAGLEHDRAAYDANPLLRDALSHVAHATIRNRGTTVGSLVHADPAAEMPAVLALLGGYVEAVSRGRGRRRIEASDFFVGPLESALTDAEMAVSAYFPDPPEGAGTAWLELSRRRGDFAMVGVGAMVRLEAGVVAAASVSLVSVGPVPVVVDLTSAVTGDTADESDWADAVDLVDQAIDPETDIHASADYRRELARVLSRRALTKAAAAARGRTIGGGT